MEDNNNSTTGVDLVQQTLSKVEKYSTWAIQNLDMGQADDGRPFVYQDGRHNRIAHPLTSRWTKRLIRKAAQAQGEFLRNDELNEILENIDALVAVTDERLQVHLRVGRDDEGCVEVDLGTEDQHRVRFKDGVAEIVTARSQTLFCRPESMLPMHAPAEHGDWPDVLLFLNTIRLHQLLMVAWMTWALSHPRGTAPYPILVIHGQQGTGKSFLCRSILRPLVDNNAAGIQRFTGDLRDIAISCQHQYLLIFDNVRELTRKQSDDLCVIATGGSVSSRRLYTNDEESLLHLHAPLVLNGIHNFIQEPDLADRCLTVRLLPLDSDARREETSIKQELEQKLPGIFRGLLDLCARALQREASAQVIHPTRLMSFSRWLAALEPVMELQPGELQLAYADNLREAALESIQENALAGTTLRFAATQPHGRWHGTPTDLLAALNAIAPAQTVHRPSEWPQTAISLSKRLKQVEPLLKAQGLEIDFSHGTQRQIELTYTPPYGANSIEEIDGLDGNAVGTATPATLDACAPVSQQGGTGNAA